MRLLISVLFLMLGLSSFAQLSDDFSDGDFSLNPAWTGETALFQISADQKLQSNGLSESDTIYLTTPNARLSDTEWRFELGYAFAPSTSNQVRIYLVSDSDNLEGPLQGYFVQIGESQSGDSYDLYRQDGSSLTQLIDGISGAAGAAINATVRVLRDDLGNWTIDIDSATTGQFISHGTAFDDTYASTSDFGVWVKHTSSRADEFFFDNFYIGDEIVDTVAPSFQQLDILSANDLVLTFDEALSNSSATETTNFVLQPGNNFPILAELSSGNPTAVELMFAMPLIDGNTYQLIYSGLEDLAGNVMTGADTVSFLLDLPDTADNKDVLINEIMADPTPSLGLPEVEYLELYNRSTKSLELEGWTISNGSTVGTLPSFLIEPDTYVILVRADRLNEFTGFGDVIGLDPMPSLVNTGDNLGLRSIEGVLIDSVDYTQDWYGDGEKDNGGYSLELIWPEQMTCPPASNWGAALTSGSPGSINSRFDSIPDNSPPSVQKSIAVSGFSIEICFDESMDEISLSSVGRYTLSPDLGIPVSVSIEGNDGKCVLLTWAEELILGTIYTLSVDSVSDCSGNVLLNAETEIAIGLPASPLDVVITEIFPDFSPSFGLPFAEFVEIYNRTDQVLDISQFGLSDGGATGTWGNQIMFPNEYLIVCQEDNIAVFSAFGKVLPMPFMPSLNNSADSLMLIDPNQNLVDRVVYTEEWYQDSEKAKGGWTLERIDANFTSCDHPENWRASLASMGGTPGTVNSIAGTFVDSLPPQVSRWEIVGPRELRLSFDEPMDDATLESLSNYTVQPDIGNPLSIDRIGSETVLLNVNTPFDSATIYELQLAQISDCSGNLLNDSIKIGIATPPAPFEVVFTEILPDFGPQVGLPEAEFIELYIRADGFVDMEGYQLTDGTSILTFGKTALLPEAYYILCAARDAADFAPFGELLIVNSLPSLNNSYDTLLLLNPSGDIVEYLFYDSDWFQDEIKDDGGWSLERIDVDFVDCNQGDNWAASLNPTGGSPGQENSVMGIFQDERNPELIGVRVPSSNQIVLEFSEQMNPATLDNLDAFSLDQGIGKPILSVTESPYRRVLSLLFDTDMELGVVYELDIAGLEDCSGNELNATVLLGIPQEAQVGDILINELLFNPYSGGSDFLEIVNVSDKILDLVDLGIGEIDGDTLFNTDPIATQSQLFLPGEMICLTADVSFQQITYLPPGNAKFWEMDAFPSYDDSKGASVVFKQSDSSFLDVFVYEDDFHFATLADDEGVSLERLSLTSPAQDPDNWHSAASTVGYATPGYENSQALAIDPANEPVRLSPQTFSPNQDGQDDVLAIQYDFDSPGGNARVSILDSRGRLVKILHQNTLLGSGPGTFYWDGTDARQNRAPIGTYIVLFEVLDINAGKLSAHRLVCVLADQF